MTTEAATIVYPETDGMPLPDGYHQSPLYVKAVSTLDVHFRDRTGVDVNGDIFIYYQEGNPRRNFSPDCYVALDLTEDGLESLARNNTYLLWEVGKSPDFILEIASESTAETDLGFKRDLYESIGVREYWRYDQTGGDFYGEALAGESLVDGVYQPLSVRRESDSRLWSHSAVLNLDLYWDNGDLRFWDPSSGEWLRDHQETHDALVTAQARIAKLEAQLQHRNGNET